MVQLRSYKIRWLLIESYKVNTSFITKIKCVIFGEEDENTTLQSNIYWKYFSCPAITNCQTLSQQYNRQILKFLYVFEKEYRRRGECFNHLSFLYKNCDHEKIINLVKERIIIVRRKQKYCLFLPSNRIILATKLRIFSTSWQIE